MDKKMLLSAALIAAVGVVMSGVPTTVSSGVAQRVNMAQASSECGSCSGGACNSACVGSCTSTCGGYYKGFLKTGISQEKPSLLPAGICEKL